jgi:tocopherol cyclase
LISADERHKVAIIPGVILGRDAHAFVQVLNGVDGTSAYHTFPIESFQATPSRFSFAVGENRFDEHHLTLNIDRPEGHLQGDIQLGPLSPWPVTLLSPGIMGWYAWVPRMECYHGVLSFNHSLQGTLTLNGITMDFSGGRGYIEKDWGQSFPNAWVWFQSNHFGNISACITASVAIIPWIGNAFRGFIAGLWLDGKLYQFATHTRAKIETLEIKDDQVKWVIQNSHHQLTLIASRNLGGLLRGPTRLDMGKRVLETLNASVQVQLKTLHGALLFEGCGNHAGLEVMGDIPRLLQD